MEQDKMKRRSFLKKLSTTLAAAVAAAPSVASASMKIPGRDRKDPRYTGQTGKRFGMVIDLRKCISCQACTAACKIENRVPAGYYRTWVAEFETGTYPAVRKVFLPQLCNHCSEPACVSVCPTGATFKRDDGIVVVDDTICWGCGYCINACPYDKRFFNPVTKVADKCTLCAHRLDRGLLPACVETCVGGARICGDLNDPKSEVSQLLQKFPTSVLRPSQGTGPMVFYIHLDRRIQEVPVASAALEDLVRKQEGTLRGEWTTIHTKEASKGE
ncbi:4Fe-4S ferredoxin, iron-sulfur binding domain protein [Thermosinus carboxydivorans Nor1]|uniref:4Fe-4S ferredoxin, iron-sulfur binding domain protein n=1 Tax=Thermosinus carboxydivorans Nor1 TaxID=401526 RepID=A1HNC7_9FIRM|nr:4Fe-4S dicluster domain-containing protein [Thermosinus carboxydivorans]EAX48290.1 4Fe-4S ferredoxin, iron-sulfur binding domain protein [Thermosinus carboxydivorans Nor1]